MAESIWQKDGNVSNASECRNIPEWLRTFQKYPE